MQAVEKETFSKILIYKKISLNINYETVVMSR